MVLAKSLKQLPSKRGGHNDLGCPGCGVFRQISRYLHVCLSQHISSKTFSSKKMSILVVVVFP